VDHATLVERLKYADFYPDAVASVDYIQTHISSVFLTGKKVYKLKKPVNFGFLDFSTVEQRERYCRAEVELNRRLAPSMYLGVEPITQEDDGLHLGGDGEVVDWLVVMRQLSQDTLGLQVLERGELCERHMDELVDLLVPFYREARTGDGIDEFGAAEAVKFNTDENFSQTEEYVGKLLSRERFEHIRKVTDRFYTEHADLFARRIAEGRIRESHGDLHLGNIFFEDPPLIFDCIEFNRRFRCGDVAVDLAFLAMDLDFHGRSDLAKRLVDGYVSASGDTELLELVNFYKMYRAYVRGKISCFTSSDPALDDMARRRNRNLARRYFGLAYHYAGGQQRPSLVVLYGLMGSGKTSISRMLRERFGWHVLSTDAVRKQLAGVGENTRVYVPYNEGLYSPEMNRRTYDEVCRRAGNLLQAGFPVVIDGAFKRQRERDPVVELADRAEARLVFVETTCSHDEQFRRLSKRQLHDTRSDGRVELMEEQREDFESAGPDRLELFETVNTDGPKDETQRRVVELLVERGVLASDEVISTAGA
jgi:hypothetical protein